MKSNGALVLFVLVTVIWLAAGHPIHQDLSYHHFANHRTIFGIPNAANVLSNIPFLVVGALGLVYAAGPRRALEMVVGRIDPDRIRIGILSSEPGQRDAGMGPVADVHHIRGGHLHFRAGWAEAGDSAVVAVVGLFDCNSSVLGGHG